MENADWVFGCKETRDGTYICSVCCQDRHLPVPVYEYRRSDLHTFYAHPDPATFGNADTDPG